MTESPEELAAVEQLLTESEALRGWLARLDQAPAGASDSVRGRVRTDYQARLDQITAGLAAHASVVSTKLADDRREHADLMARATAARDALAEAELRHAVGEYDGKRFDGEQRRYSSDIETFELSIAAVAERIARLEDVHALVERGPRPTLAEMDSPGANFESVMEIGEIEITELAPDPEPGLSVFDPSELVPDDGRAVVPPSMSPEIGPLSFRPSGAVGDRPHPVAAPPTRPRPFESAAPLGIPAADIPPRFVRPGERLVTPPAPPATAPVADPPQVASVAAPAGVGNPGTEPEASAAPVGRTLRCGECGAMNRPLEWYCEKCGAELTAV